MLRSTVIGGTLRGMGWLTAALGHFHFIFTVAGIGLVAGLGVLVIVTFFGVWKNALVLDSTRGTVR